MMNMTARPLYFSVFFLMLFIVFNYTIVEIQ